MQGAEQIGSGSYGFVYKVQKSGKEYALKQIHFEDRIQNLLEIDLLSRFYHPNLMHVIEIDFDLVNNIIKLYLPLGKSSLFQVKTKELPDNQKYEYMRQITSAIHFLHQMGFEHCDLKPENIIIYENRLLLSDFGLSLSQYNPYRICLQSSFYRPPEVFNKYQNLSQYSSSVFEAYIKKHPKDYTMDDLTSLNDSAKYFINPSSKIASDLWALGVVIYVIYTGKSPFFADSLEGVLLKIGRYLQHPDAFLNLLPPELRIPISLLMNPIPTKRSMSEFVKATGLTLIPGTKKKIIRQLDDLDYDSLNPVFSQIYLDYWTFGLTSYEYLGALDLAVRMAPFEVHDYKLLGKVVLYMMNEILDEADLYDDIYHYLAPDYTPADLIRQEVQVIQDLKGIIVPEDLLDKVHQTKIGRLTELTPTDFVQKYLTGL